MSDEALLACSMCAHQSPHTSEPPRPGTQLTTGVGQSRSPDTHLTRTPLKSHRADGPGSPRFRHPKRRDATSAPPAPRMRHVQHGAQQHQTRACMRACAAWSTAAPVPCMGCRTMGARGRCSAPLLRATPPTPLPHAHTHIHIMHTGDASCLAASPPTPSARAVAPPPPLCPLPASSTSASASASAFGLSLRPQFSAPGRSSTPPR